jgi:hypothetical protein
MRVSKKRLPISENNEMKPWRRPMRKPGGRCTFGTVCVAHDASDRTNAKRRRRTASPRHFMCASGNSSGVPDSVDVRNKTRNKRQVERTFAEDLIGNVNVVALQSLWRSAGVNRAASTPSVLLATNSP